MTGQTQTDFDKAVSFLRDWYHEDIARFAQRYPKEQTVLEISFEDLRRGRPELAELYQDEPARIHGILQEALENVELPVDIDMSSATVRVTDISNAENLVWTVGDLLPQEIDADCTFLRGQVTKTSQPQIRFTEAIYECTRCGTNHRLPVGRKNEELPEPHECSGCERQGPFELLTDRMRASAVNHQLVRLQTPPEETGGQDDETLDIVFEDDLVKACSPGDQVTVAAQMDTLIADGGSMPTGEFRGYAESVDLEETDFSDINYEEHRDRIEEIANSLDPHEKIVDSILPSHYGDRKIKEAIAYQLFSGVDGTLPDGSSKRGNIHIFLVGDPGVGKTDLMQYVNTIAPRSVFSTGTGSTKAGLTCAAVQDDFGAGGWTLEAGALVKAHNGLALIDELDDMEEEDRAALLEAMESGKISVSKAGINATLPADSSVLAAANPDFGRFDRYDPLAEQVSVHPALISRFDLIFPMIDEHEPDRDEKIADKVLESNQAAQAAQSTTAAPGSDTQPAIDPDVLRAYIALAREIVPVLSDDAMAAIKEHYIKIRHINDDDDSPIPTTARTLGTLTRLSEASARIRLSETVTREDATRAITIYNEFIEQLGVDPETNELDADVVETGTSTSQRDRMQAVKRIIASLEEEYESGAPHDAVVDHVSLDDYDEGKIVHSIQKLKDQGEMYESQSGHYRTA